MVFAHGWGFDSRIWEGVASRLGGAAHAFCEAGYFGSASTPQVDGPVLAVSHSFGAMRVLGTYAGKCAGLIAVNGFDRFCAADGFPGTPPRVLDRMAARFEIEPSATLTDFRVRCGHDEPFGDFDKVLLARDLAALRHGDRRKEAAGFPGPVLSLQGRTDPLLAAPMQEAVFASAPMLTRETVADGGHLLPLTHPGLVADRIRAMAEALA